MLTGKNNNRIMLYIASLVLGLYSHNPLCAADLGSADIMLDLHFAPELTVSLAAPLLHPTPAAGSLAGITQYGDSHRAAITQQGRHNQALVQQSGVGNEAYVEQGGQANQALQQQSGQNNYARSQQYGSGNLSYQYQYGDGHRSTVTQVGNGNVVIVRQGY